MVRISNIVTGSLSAPELRRRNYFGRCEPSLIKTNCSTRCRSLQKLPRTTTALTRPTFGRFQNQSVLVGISLLLSRIVKDSVQSNFKALMAHIGEKSIWKLNILALVQTWQIGVTQSLHFLQSSKFCTKTDRLKTASNEKLISGTFVTRTNILTWKLFLLNE